MAMTYFNPLRLITRMPPRNRLASHELGLRRSRPQPERRYKTPGFGEAILVVFQGCCGRLFCCGVSLLLIFLFYFLFRLDFLLSCSLFFLRYRFANTNAFTQDSVLFSMVLGRKTPIQTTLPDSVGVPPPWLLASLPRWFERGCEGMDGNGMDGMHGEENEVF